MPRANMPFLIRCSTCARAGCTTEQDERRRCCTRLADAYLRDCPTLPADWENTKKSWVRVETAIRLPCFSCPFIDCSFCTDDREKYMLHVGSEAPDAPHLQQIIEVCGNIGTVPGVSAIDWVEGATGVAERRKFPTIGAATTRRALRRLAQVFNDDTVRTLACFCCGKQQTTWSGPPDIDYQTGSCAPGRAEINMFGAAWFVELEQQKKGSLACNCGYDSWRQRYVAVSLLSILIL